MMSKSSSQAAPEPAGPAQKSIEPLFSSEQIAERIEALAETIAAWRVSPQPLVLIAVLRGAVPFVADLARALSVREVPLVIDYVSAESYRNRSSTGEVALGPPPNLALARHDVLIVDDILDTGLTLAAVLDSFEHTMPTQLAACVLLDKTTRRLNGLKADFVGFECPDTFVVGYGMDLDGRYRELPFIGTVAD
jgi:hypoxanthine phosphoribosyltransferase